MGIQFFPEGFPHELMKKAISLEALGTPEMAWKYQDAKLAIESFAERGYAILGGDVYQAVNERIITTYDSWFFNNDGQDWEAYLIRSKVIAMQYVDQYYKAKGDSFYYTIVAALNGWRKN